MIKVCKLCWIGNGYDKLVKKIASFMYNQGDEDL